MTGPAYHGWTHRPKAEGGTDPIPGLTGGGWSGPTMYTPLNPNFANDRKDTQSGVLHTWRTIADTTKWSTFYLTNATNGSNNAWAPGSSYYGFNLGPQGSVWGIQLVFDQNTNGGKLTFKWATDPETPDTPVDPASLSYFETMANPLNMHGTSGTVEDSALGIFRINGQAGDMLTADATGFDSDFTFASSMNGGPGLWWLNLEVTDGDPPNGAYRAVLRHLLLVRYSDFAMA